jgi:hypothetical protein
MYMTVNLSNNLENILMSIVSHYQAPVEVYRRNTCNNTLLNIIEIQFLHARNLCVLIYPKLYYVDVELYIKIKY